MSELTLPKDVAHRPSGLVAMFQHARYVLRDNVVTGFAFGLFVLIVLAALVGPMWYRLIRSRATPPPRSSRPRPRIGSAPTSSAATCSAA